MSSGSRRGVRSAIVFSTTAAGTINQTTLGFRNFLTRSCSEDAPTAFSPTRSLTALGDLSNTTPSCPPLIRRRTMLAPILPRPTIPNCMNVSFCYFYVFALLTLHRRFQANAQFVHSGCHSLRVAEHSRSCYQYVGSCGNAERRRIRIDSSIQFEIAFG